MPASSNAIRAGRAFIEMTLRDQALHQGLQNEETMPAPSTEACPSDDRSEANRYRAAFGEQGLAWFADGVAWDEAEARYARQVRDGVADRSETRRSRDAFGEQGLVWFADGMPWEDAQVRHAVEIREEAEASERALHARIHALEVRPAAADQATGELTPVGFSSAGETADGNQRRGFAGRLRFPPPA